jgi:hypothetical protein
MPSRPGSAAAAAHGAKVFSAEESGKDKKRHTHYCHILGSKF